MAWTEMLQTILEMCAQSPSAVPLERLGQYLSVDKGTLLRQLGMLQGLGFLELLRSAKGSAISTAARITPRGFRYVIEQRTQFRRDALELERWEARFRDLLPFSR